MSRPYCKTCKWFDPRSWQPECSEGECMDPSKIIMHGVGGPINSPPIVDADCYTCSNHTPVDGDNN